ncbi:MAG: EamA family transporter [Candidatus Heimdallarchaeota archaeon]|nr:EamA family transporter [Candidatus Heimdallarchaeota archaeon]
MLQNEEKRPLLLAYLLLVIATIIWGGSWPLGRWLVSEDVGGETIPPLIIAVVRYFIVIWCFFALLKWREGSINFSLIKTDWKPLVLMGITSVTIYQIGYLIGEYYTAASDASLIVATNPIWVFILSGIFLREGLGRKKIIGGFLAFIGVMLVVGFSPNVDVPNRILGDLFILLAALGYSVYTVVYRNYINNFSSPEKPSSLYVITWVSFFGFLITTPIALVISPEYLNPQLYLQIPERIWYGVAYLAFLSTIGAYWFYLEGIKRLNASRASIFINLVPVFGVTFSVIFLGELIDPLIHISAFVLIASGVVLVNSNNLGNSISLTELKKKAKRLKKEIFTIYLISTDKRVSWWKRAILAIIIGYAISPIDLIPDFIPLLGYIDDLILVPAGIFIALKLIPKIVIDDARKKASVIVDQSIPIGKKTTAAIICIWVCGFLLLSLWIMNILTMRFIQS